jgi:hypothetical protein
VAGWIHPGPPFTKQEQCRDLVLSRRPLPRVGSRQQPLPLTEEEFRQLFTVPNAWGGSPSPAPASSSSPAPAPSPSNAPAPAPQAAASISVDDFRLLQRQLLEQRAEIEALKDGQGGDLDEVSSTYEVGFSSLSLLPGEGAGSWNDLSMMTTKDRKRLLREHTGTFESFPKDLEFKEVFGDYPAVKNLTVSFASFVKEDVRRALTFNKGTIQALLTVHSKLEELSSELLGVSMEDENDEGINDDATVNAKDAREKILLLLENVSGAARLALDAHAGLRLSVSNKVMQSIGAKHLTKAPNDKEKDDFISADVAEKIMERADLKESARIATTANYKGIFGTPSSTSRGNGGKSGRLSKGFNSPSPRSSGNQGRGGGGRSKGGKGGKGGGRGGGRGRGKGTGGSSDKTASSSGAAPTP